MKNLSNMLPGGSSTSEGPLVDMHHCTQVAFPCIGINVYLLDLRDSSFEYLANPTWNNSSEDVFDRSGFNAWVVD
jgi:hypothetical protein